MTGGERIPAAVPVAWSNQTASLAPAGGSAQSRATTTTHSVRASSRAGRRGLAVAHASLSARDWDVLRTVARHRYVTTRQVEAFHFHDHATALTGARVCRRTLRRLATLRVLDALERRIGGVRAGSASFVWQVGPVGDRLLPGSADGSRTRQHEPGRLFLGHCLAIADAHLALVQADRSTQLELVAVQTEPECWRHYTGLGGARLVLQPDLYIVTGDPADSDFVNCWFVEIDRGTENPARLLAKCARYETYRRTGAEQSDGDSFPIVVWVMTEQRQAERLNKLIEHDTALDRRLYRVTIAEQFVAVIRGGVA